MLLAAMEFLQFGDILAENSSFENTVLQAGQVGRQFRSGLRGQRIYPPSAADFNFDHPMATEVRQLLGCSYRTDAKNFLKMTNTLGLKAQQIENPQAVEIAEAFVDSDDGISLGLRGRHGIAYISHQLNKRKMNDAHRATNSCLESIFQMRF